MIDVKSTKIGDLVHLDPNLTWHDDWPGGWLTVEGVGRDAQGRTVDVRSQDGRRWMFDADALLPDAGPVVVARLNALHAQKVADRAEIEAESEEVPTTPSAGSLGPVTSHVRGKINNEPGDTVAHLTERLNRLAARIPGAEQHDEPTHPSHYQIGLPDGGSVEVIDILQARFPTDPLLWNTGKYLLRAGHKGPALPDLVKARDYLNWAIDRDRKKAQK